MVFRNLRSGARRKKNCATQEPRYAKHQDIDRRSTHNLIRFELDAADSVDGGDEKARKHSAQQSDPRTRTAHSQPCVGSIGNCRGRESSSEHLSFESNIDDSRPLRKETAKCCEHEWSSETNGRCHQRNGEDVSHGCTRKRSIEALLPRSHLKKASAATNKMIIPCNTCTMSLVTFSEKPST